MTASQRPPRPTWIAGPTGDAAAPGAQIDDRTVRVRVAAASRLEGDPLILLSPAPGAVSRSSGLGAGDPGVALVDGVPTNVRLERFGGVRVRFVESSEGRPGGPAIRTDVLFGPVRRDGVNGTRRREMVVNGWRIEVEVESERRAALRERAQRATGGASPGGPVEIRAIIPGRVVAVSVAAGDPVAAGQQVLVVEAMKMQNELRVPREGAVERVAVAVGDTIEVGDLLVVIH